MAESESSKNGLESKLGYYNSVYFILYAEFCANLLKDVATSLKMPNSDSHTSKIGYLRPVCLTNDKRGTGHISKPPRTIDAFASSV